MALLGYKCRSSLIRLGSILVTSVNLNYFLKGFTHKHSHIVVRTSSCEQGYSQSVHISNWKTRWESEFRLEHGDINMSTETELIVLMRLRKVTMERVGLNGSVMPGNTNMNTMPGNTP